jgi:hypothetical protein
MIKSKIFLIAVMNTIFIYSQQLPDRKVFATAGKDLKNAYILAPASQQNRLTFTMGEPIIGLGTISGKRLFNGFIQFDGVFPVSPPSPVLMPTMDPFKVFPNPTTEGVKIIAPEEWDAKVTIQLIDLQGKLVREYNMEDKIIQIEFDASVAPGNYFLNFYQENGLIIQQTKLIKQNNH